MSIDAIALPQTQLPTAKQEWARSWTIVLAAALGFAITTSHVNFIGAMMKPLQQAYGWGRGEIAFGVTLISTLVCLSYLFTGVLADRYGPRRLALGGCLGFGVGFCLLGFAGPSVLSWYVLCAVFSLIGQLANIVVWTMMVVRHFHTSRGLALALTLCGGGLAVSVTPMLVVFLNASFDVRTVFLLWGSVGGAFVLISTFFFFRDPATAVRIDTPKVSAPATIPIGHALRDAFRDRNFWQFSVSVLLVALAVGSFYVHIQPMLHDSGLSPELAASVAMVIGPSLIAGRVSIGYFLDRVDCRLVSSVAFCLPAVACGLLAILDGSYALAIFAGFIIGLGLGAEVDIVAYLTSHYFGTRNYGKIFAILNGLFSIGLGVGSTLAGFVFDMTGTYKTVLLIMSVFAILAVLLIATLGKPKNTEAFMPQVS
jgi:MFS family permease